MIHALLVVGGTQAERLAKAQAIIKKALGLELDLERGHPDILIFEPTASIGINQIRQLQKKLALKPYSANLKVALLTTAEKLTLPAQNALLKTLEEPPAKSLIILTTAKSALLLPTIVSRCQLIKLPVKTEIKLDKEALNNQQSIINNILKSGAGERLQQAEKLTKNRDQAIKFCQEQLWLWRKILLARINSSPKQKISLNYQQIIQTLKTIRSTLSLLEANVNPRLAIEALLLSFPRLNQT